MGMSMVALGGLAAAWRYKWAHPIIRPVIVYATFVAAAELGFRVWVQFWWDPTQFDIGRALAIGAQFLLGSVLILWVVAIWRYEKVSRGNG